MKHANAMEAYSQRGYYAKENAPVYFTRDIQKTCDWFCNVLGWYGDVILDDDGHAASYSCVFDYPGELIVSGLTPFRGIHLFQGEPIQGVVGFIMVQGLEKLHQLVRENGWTQISDMTAQPWGAKECCVTTLDGSVLRLDVYKRQEPLRAHLGPGDQRAGRPFQQRGHPVGVALGHAPAVAPQGGGGQRHGQPPRRQG